MNPTIESKQAAMPPEFLEWQCEERRLMFAALNKGQMPSFLASHLPVVSTLNDGVTHPPTVPHPT